MDPPTCRPKPVYFFSHMCESTAAGRNYRNTESTGPNTKGMNTMIEEYMNKGLSFDQAYRHWKSTLPEVFQLMLTEGDLSECVVCDNYACSGDNIVCMECVVAIEAEIESENTGSPRCIDCGIVTEVYDTNREAHLCNDCFEGQYEVVDQVDLGALLWMFGTELSMN